MRMAMVIVALVVAPLAPAGVIEGRLIFYGGGIPGCTVTLTSPPTSKSDCPRCADTELHDALIACVEQGDRSALALLQREER